MHRVEVRVSVLIHSCLDPPAFNVTICHRLLQMQTFVVELIGTFDLSLTSPSQTIRREACFVMTPTVEGEQEKGTQLNLLVKLAEDR